MHHAEEQRKLFWQLSLINDGSICCLISVGAFNFKTHPDRSLQQSVNGLENKKLYTGRSIIAFNDKVKGTRAGVETLSHF